MVELFSPAFVQGSNQIGFRPRIRYLEKIGTPKKPENHLLDSKFMIFSSEVSRDYYFKAQLIFHETMGLPKRGANLFSDGLGLLTVGY